MRNYKCLSSASFQSEQFRLVPIRDEDQHLILKWRNEQIYHLRQAKPLTEEDQKNYFETTIAGLFDQEKPAQLLFSLLENDQCIGYGGLVHINWVDQYAEVSFIMNTEFESNRFDEIWTVYLSLLNEIAFTELNLHKLFTYAFDLRPHLYPVVEKCGFQLEARLKEHCFFNGEYKDVFIHSKFNSTKQLFLREVTEADVELLFDWANEPAVRANSLNSAEIQFDSHQKWFASQLSNPEANLFVLTDGKDALGQIRIQLKNGLWEIGYSIDKNQRGKRLGFEIVRLLINRFPEYPLKAVVKQNNPASIKVFEKLGFELVGGREEEIFTFVKTKRP